MTKTPNPGIVACEAIKRELQKSQSPYGYIHPLICYIDALIEAQKETHDAATGSAEEKTGEKT